MKTEFKVYKKDLEKAIKEIHAPLKDYATTGPCHCVIAQAITRHFEEPVKVMGVSSAHTVTKRIDWHGSGAGDYRDVLDAFDNNKFDECRALLPLTIKCSVADLRVKS